MCSAEIEKFEIRREVKFSMVPGHRMRNEGADIVEIVRSEDCYFVRMHLADKGPSADSANSILNLHFKSAIAALEEYKGRFDSGSGARTTLQRVDGGCQHHPRRSAPEADSSGGV